MSETRNDSTANATLRAAEINGRRVKRRSFLHTFGLLSGAGGLAAMTTACSDECDHDVADLARFDLDLFDPIRVDSDRTDPCDSDG